MLHMLARSLQVAVQCEKASRMELMLAGRMQAAVARQRTRW